MSDRKKILVIDDDEAVTDLLQTKLEAHYDVISTNAPENVLNLVRNQRPDLVICDIDMPDMDGGEVSAELLKSSDTRHIPFLFLTALASPQELEARRKELGGRPAISKHSSTRDLLARIKALL